MQGLRRYARCSRGRSRRSGGSHRSVRTDCPRRLRPGHGGGMDRATSVRESRGTRLSPPLSLLRPSILHNSRGRVMQPAAGRWPRVTCVARVHPPHRAWRLGQPSGHPDQGTRAPRGAPSQPVAAAVQSVNDGEQHSGFALDLVEAHASRAAHEVLRGFPGVFARLKQVAERQRELARKIEPRLDQGGLRTVGLPSSRRQAMLRGRVPAVGSRTAERTAKRPSCEHISSTT